MAIFLFFMILFGLISRQVHGACCVTIKHRIRMAIFFWLTFLSFIAISIACFYDHVPAMFWLAVFSSIFQGVS